MIQTLADLLNQIKDAERQKIDALGIKHRPTIGNMYEGLTAELLGKTLFTGLNLNIVQNSFAIYSDGQRSTEFDIMLIEGEGKPLPHSKEQFDVGIEQVIAIIQVKKTINKSQIEEAYLNLNNAYDYGDIADPPEGSLRLFRDAFIGNCNEDIFDRGRFRKQFSSVTCEQIFHILRYESMLPARIVFGYQGYKSEFSLREGFVKFLKKNKSSETDLKHGFGPSNFPDLFINGEYSLIKGNGMPYIGGMIDHQWAFYLSSAEDPLLKLLEIIWTRLSYRFNITADIFGDDLEMEGANVFLLANMVNISGIKAWNIHYEPMSKKRLEESHGNIEWTPTKISNDQHHVIAYLAQNGKLRIDKLNEWMNLIGKQVDEMDFAAELTKTKLVGITSGFELVLLTEQCECVCLPQLGFYAADNKTGKLDRWVSKHYSKSK